MFLVDTNVISETAKSRPNPRVQSWSSIRTEELYISVMTVGEIVKGIERLSPGERRTNLGRWLALLTSTDFNERVLPIDSRIAAEWGRLCVALKRTLPCADSLLAATARVHGLTIATRNVKDFVGFGVRVIDPWAL
jgi:predicted nucleic acid-binding protein